MGRSFLSPEGGIYLSVILRPQGSAEDLLPLTALLAAVACDAVEEACGFRPQIKWLNDLVAGDKKLAGILTELVLDSAGGVTAAVCGIGINCLNTEDAFSPEVRAMATSLAAVTGKEPDRNALAGLLIRKIADVLQPAQRTALMTQYRRDCMTLGKTVRVVRGDESYIATAQHIDDDGALWVLTETGERKKVLSGEVSVRGLYGYATPLHNDENVV
jgi:BirA family biotin operon repressor/biotin-[acetyl-CoA-carboxylase] ligase